MISTLVWLLCIFIGIAILERVAIATSLIYDWFAIRKQQRLRRLLTKSGIFDSPTNNQN